MKKKTSPIIILLFGIAMNIVQGQTNKETFEKFARQEDSLMRLAYKNRDTIKYKQELSAFLTKYNELPSSDKKELFSLTGNEYYNLCCTYALLGNKDNAIQYLGKSIEGGYLDYDHIQHDKDLSNIREEQKYKDIMIRLRGISDYLYILRKAAKYNDIEEQQLPDFTYQSKDNVNLRELRKAFNLDSIAGEGTEIYRMINLMRWVHELIPHDGNHDNPVIKNAMSMIAECRQAHRGLNCRGLAMVLNECYLSMGFKSRIVTCLPKDSLKIDQDCHVINIVYCDSLKKWIWMDPTHAAYVMNEKGEVLSIEEVRERIINNRVLILNPDANWNRHTVTIEAYLYTYMAKNLYILESPVNSEYNMETRESGKTYPYISLLPLDYYEQMGHTHKETDPSTKTTWVWYKTNNSKKFWKAPQ
jgi:hypothetical protein